MWVGVSESERVGEVSRGFSSLGLFGTRESGMGLSAQVFRPSLSLTLSFSLSLFLPLTCFRSYILACTSRTLPPPPPPSHLLQVVYLGLHVQDTAAELGLGQ